MSKGLLMLRGGFRVMLVKKLYLCSTIPMSMSMRFEAKHKVFRVFKNFKNITI